MRWLFDICWITVVTLIIMLGSVLIPMKCQAQDAIPNRKSFFEGQGMYQVIHEAVVRGMKLRQQAPDHEFRVQAWANMKTGFWNLHVIEIFRHQVGNRRQYLMFLHVPGLPTPYEYRNKTAEELIWSVSLTEWEWYHGRNGDI